jgi:hypothetical protein
MRMRMRLNSWVWLTTLILGLFTIGSVVAPCHAAVLDSPAEKSAPIITNATLASEETIPSKAAFQSSYLSLSLTTDKPVYLTGETINITVSTSTANTRVRVQAQLPSGSQETVGNFTTSGTYTLSWTAPSTPGYIRFACYGDAIVRIQSICRRAVCDNTTCWWMPYPCLRSIRVTGEAYSDVRVFKRDTFIFGRVIDTNQRPVSGANVHLTSTLQSTTTNNDGFYEFNSYQLGNNYALVNGIPTATETVSVEAIACEPQPGITVKVQAEQGATNVNFTLRRAFYPPGIDLSEFTFDAFSGWPEAGEYSTWQNILGITIDGQVEPRELSYGRKDIPLRLFNIGNKKLYLITNPEFGRYSLELQGAQNAGYTVAAAATLSNTYLEPVTVSASIERQNSQRLRLTLQPGGIELQVVKPLPLLAIIIPIVVVLLGGLAAAYFLTGRKFRIPGKKPAARKSQKTKVAARIKTKKKSTARNAKTEVKIRRKKV